MRLEGNDTQRQSTCIQPLLGIFLEGNKVTCVKCIVCTTTKLVFIVVCIAGGASEKCGVPSLSTVIQAQPVNYLCW